MSDKKVDREENSFKETEKALQAASSIPYNNARVVYEAAGINPDPRMGGSCLFKLHFLLNSLPENTQDVRFITSQTGSTTYYAMLAQINNADFYFDPFLWQKEPLNIDLSDTADVETIQKKWILRKQGKGTNLSVSLVDNHLPQKPFPLITHNFVNTLDFLPNPSALPIRPDLPSFNMQIPDPNGIFIYKLWYFKDIKKFGDLWVGNTVTGEKTKLDYKDKTMRREAVFSRIEEITGNSIQQIQQYFDKAHELEIQLSQLISRSGDDMPHVLE